MKRILPLFALCTSLLSFGQGMSPELFEDYLNEKVRLPECREAVEAIMDINEKVESGEYTITQAEVEAALIREETERAIAANYPSNEFRAGVIDENAMGSGGAEPFIALHPTDANRLCASYMESGSAFDYPIYYTTDGGSNWNLSTFSPAAQHATEFPSGTIAGGGDPVLAYDEDGTIHMTWIYLRIEGFSLKAAMLYAYSTDDGATFTVPGGGDHIIHDGNLLTSDMLDRQWMYVDNTGGTYDGNLYMSAIYFGGALGGAGEVVLTKPYGSTTFGAPVAAVTFSGSEGAQFGNVKVDDSGTVHVGCMKFTDQSTGVGHIVHTMSTDGGMTWSTPTQIAPCESKLPQGSGHMVHDRDNTATSLAVGNNNVYMAWTDQGSSDTKAYFAYSNDGGVNWSAAVDLGAATYPGNFYHLMPNVSASGNNASISWYVVDKTTLGSSYNMVELESGGTVIGSAGLVNALNFDFSAAAGGDFFGDYNTSVRNGCDTWSIWSDNRTGSPVVYIARVDACSITGLSEQTPLNAGIKVSNLYPVPTTGNITLDIDLARNDNIVVELYDVTGKKMDQLFSGELIEGANQLTIDLTSYPAANYLVKVSNSDGAFVSRSVVKQ